MRLAAGITSTLFGCMVLSACAKGAAGLGDGGEFAASDDSVRVVDGGGGLDGALPGMRDAESDTPDPDTRMDAGPRVEPADDAGDAPEDNVPDAQARLDAGLADAAAVDLDATDSGGLKPDASKPPPDPCAEICNDDRSPDARSCASVVTVGRKSALRDDFVYNGDTRNAGDKQDLDFINCADGNADNFFRIYLYTDDTITVRLATAEYDPVIKLVTGPSCEVVESAACVDVGLDGDNEVLNVLIPSDGWYYVVADGPFGPTAAEGQGRYTLSVSVASKTGVGRCACP